VQIDMFKWSLHDAFRLCTMVYPKVSGLAAWSENYYVQLYRYFVSQSNEFCRHKTLCAASQQVLIVVSVYFVIDSVRKLLDTPSYLVQTRRVITSNCIRGLPVSFVSSIRKYVDGRRWEGWHHNYEWL
jgi:hypothetical protein